MRIYAGAAIAALGLALAHLSPVLFPDPGFIAPFGLCISVASLAVLYGCWRKIRSPIKATLCGFLVGLVYFGVSLYWLGASADPDPDTVAPREIVTTAGVLWLFVPWWALWFGAARLLAPESSRGIAPPIAFLLCYSVSDLLLSDIVFGIPLAPISRTVLDTGLAGLLAILGTHATNAVMLATAIILFHLKKNWQFLSVGLGIPALLTLTVLPRDIPAVPEAERADIYLAQPSLPHVSQITDPDPEALIHRTMLGHIDRGVEAGAPLIVLPEAAFAVDLSEDDAAVAEIAARLPEDTVVIAGYTRIEVQDHEDGTFEIRPFNTAMFIDADGPTGMKYDKAHLVPFGETMPALFFALGFDVMTGPSGGFGAGEQIEVFQPGDLPPFALLICYEALLSGPVSRETSGAEWLLNISSEALFTGTIGPRLLLDYARMRAIETGLPVLRATANAYSSVILADGTVSASLAPLEKGGLTVTVPESRWTLFRSTGQFPLYSLWAALGLLLIGNAFFRRRAAVTPASA